MVTELRPSSPLYNFGANPLDVCPCAPVNDVTHGPLANAAQGRQFHDRDAAPRELADNAGLILREECLPVVATAYMPLWMQPHAVTRSRSRAAFVISVGAVLLRGAKEQVPEARQSDAAYGMRPDLVVADTAAYIAGMADHLARRDRRAARQFIGKSMGADHCATDADLRVAARRGQVSKPTIPVLRVAIGKRTILADVQGKALGRRQGDKPCRAVLATPNIVCLTEALGENRATTTGYATVVVHDTPSSCCASRRLRDWRSRLRHYSMIEDN